ncbi:MAG TPA: HAD-IA family hydrolase [Urbifossiella sp.]|jgi:putative hydrolase of the HAD superfamily
MSQWVHPGIRAVVFDAVGTLLFPQPSAPEIYRTLALRQGVELPAEAIRRQFVEAFRIEEDADRANRWITSEQRERDRWRTIVTTTLSVLPDPESAFAELFDHFALPAAWQLHEDAECVFRSLGNRGVRIGMGTNYDSRVRSVIAGLPGLAPLQDRVVVSAAIGFRKPAPEFFQEVARTMGCEPRHVLFVGDDVENDFEGASAAGMEAVLLDPRGQSTLPRRIERLRELSA